MVDLDALEALLAKATPGPWVYDDGVRCGEGQYPEPCDPPAINAGGKALIEAVEPGYGGDENLAALAALRNAAEALIAEARAGRKLREACVRLFGREVRFGVSPHAILEYDRATSTGGAP